MPHVQAKLDEQTFKEVKKDAIDKEEAIGDYVKDAVVKKLEQSKLTEASESALNNQTETKK